MHRYFLAIVFGCVGFMPVTRGEDTVGRSMPDLVFFIADDLSSRDLGLYGGIDIPTPAIDRLAARGMTFDAAFVASPSCAPSRAALLTALMPARNGAQDNHSYPGDHAPSMPQMLRDRGYQTAAFGKVAHNKSASQYGFEVIEPGKEIPQLRESVSRFLDERSDERPLAMFVGTSDPHVPWPPRSTVAPEAIRLPPTQIDTPRTRVQRSRYLQEVIDLDEFFGWLVEETDKRLGGDKVTVFTSDHGSQFPLGKWTLYDEGIRVPLVMVWPDHIAEKARTDAMVSFVDLFPTLMDLAGKPIDASETDAPLDGRSFADVLRGDSDTHREFIFATHTGDRKMNVYPSRSVRTERYKYIRNPHPEFAFTTHIDLLRRDTSGDYFEEWDRAARNDRDAAAKLARYRGRPAEELYDLRADPYEIDNLASDPDHAETVAKLSGRLDQWLQSQQDDIAVLYEPLLLDAPETWKPRK